MALESIKKRILTLKIVICIIINFLRLRNLHNSIMSSNLINKLALIKDLTKLSYDIITFNFVSVMFNSLPLYMKIKKIFRKLKKPHINIFDETNDDANEDTNDE
jgi:hypothetical protein